MRHSRRLSLSLAGALVLAALLAGLSRGPGAGAGPEPRAAAGSPGPASGSLTAAASAEPVPALPSRAGRAGSEPRLAPTPPGAVPEGPGRGGAPAGAEGAEAAPGEPDPEPLRAPIPGIELDAPRLEVGGDLARLSGFDPGAPRPLWIWRKVGDEAAVVAVGRSEPGGAIELPPLAVPSRGLTLYATPEGVVPGAPGSSQAVHAAAGAPPAPGARLQRGPAGERWLRIQPGVAGGEIVVVAQDGAVLARRDVPERPSARDRAFDIELFAPLGAQEVRIAHERADAERSPWTAVALESSKTKGEMDHVE